MIRASIIIFDGDRLLLVHETAPTDKRSLGGQVDWWGLPGGSVEGDESIFACAEREAREETGLIVTLDRIVYVLELVNYERLVHRVEFCVLASGFEGTLQVSDADAVQSTDFFTQRELDEVAVYPNFLRFDLWEDLERGFPETKYRGIEHTDQT